MATYTVTLTEVEDKALRVVAMDPQDWIDNAVHERCRIAIDSIAESEIKRKFALGESITGTKEELVMSPSIKTAAQLEVERNQN
jgi:hypothetical protein